MSTLMYAAVTAKREEAEPRTSTTQTPGIAMYVDALAALVPAEVLAVHAGILTFTTASVKDGAGNVTVRITEPGTLWWVFWALVVLSTVVYFAGLGRTKWDSWDWLRVLIPAAAFVGWTMLQKGSAFDAVAPNLPSATRSAIAVIGAVGLGLLARGLASKADQKNPRRNGDETEPRPSTEQTVAGAASG
jgi:hypothetical protein